MRNVPKPFDLERILAGVDRPDDWEVILDQSKTAAYQGYAEQVERQNHFVRLGNMGALTLLTLVFMAVLTLLFGLPMPISWQLLGLAVSTSVLLAAAFFITRRLDGRNVSVPLPALPRDAIPAERWDQVAYVQKRAVELLSKLRVSGSPFGGPDSLLVTDFHNAIFAVASEGSEFGDDYANAVVQKMEAVIEPLIASSESRDALSILSDTEEREGGMARLLRFVP